VFLKYTYLIINLASISIPFIWSFEPKVNFIKYWKPLFAGIFAMMVIFIPWDVYFTKIGVWGFNENYITNIWILGLPLEEILFFICIPYASVFTHEALKFYLPKNPLQNLSKPITIFLSFLLLVVVAFHWGNYYTNSTFILAVALIITLEFVLKAKFLVRIYFSFGIILIPFFIVNGLLTGSLIDEPIVWYNNHENLGIRIGTIPIEDAVYALAMLITTISVYEVVKDKAYKLN